MKRILVVITLLGVFFAPIYLNAGHVMERDLQPEKASSPDPDRANQVERTTVIKAFANSKDVTIVGGVIGALYYFCNEPTNEFCSKYEGVLVVSGADTGKEPEMLRALDIALEEQVPIKLELSEEKLFMGVKKIVDVKLMN